jgi:hypothetical protein
VVISLLSSPVRLRGRVYCCIHREALLFVVEQGLSFVNPETTCPFTPTHARPHRYYNLNSGNSPCMLSGNCRTVSCCYLRSTSSQSGVLLYCCIHRNSRADCSSFQIQDLLSNQEQRGARPDKARIAALVSALIFPAAAATIHTNSRPSICNSKPLRVRASDKYATAVVNPAIGVTSG